MLQHQKTSLSQFDELTKELLNIKDVIIKNLEAEMDCLREKVRNLESKILSKSTKTSLSITTEETILKYLVFLAIELEKIEIVPNNKLFVLLIESLPNKNFITGKN